MRTNILNSIIRAAATFALPAALWAQDLSTTSSELGAARPPVAASQNSTPSPDAGSAPPSPRSPVMSGIMVQDGSAYIVHRLQGVMSLPDGSKVQPNGTILSRDGSMHSMGSGQMLTLDGRMMPAPFGGEGMMGNGVMGLGAGGLPGDLFGSDFLGFGSEDFRLSPEDGSLSLSSPAPSTPSAGTPVPESRNRDDNNLPNSSGEPPAPNGDFSD